MDAIDLVKESAHKFYNDKNRGEFGRYRSWEHCYKQFHDARKNPNPDYDYLSLHLAFYLASWGMYRGSSFLLQKDYKIHEPVVKDILRPEYDCLFGVCIQDLKNSQIRKCLFDLVKSIENYYNKIRIEEKCNVQCKLSSTLITKILMGTLGCVPAYDRYFVDGIKCKKVSSGTFNPKSLMKLVNFYEDNYSALEEIRLSMKAYDLPYPQMKILDMGFWQIGYEKDLQPE